jgi:hypothetical protein
LDERELAASLEATACALCTAGITPTASRRATQASAVAQLLQRDSDNDSDSGSDSGGGGDRRLARVSGCSPQPASEAVHACNGAPAADSSGRPAEAPADIGALGQLAGVPAAQEGAQQHGEQAER